MVRDRRAPRPPIRVLIADGDARVRTALRTFLVAHHGFEVVGEAGDPVRTLELAQRAAPCVAVVDVVMPDIQDGLDLLRALTANRIPVIAMSLRPTLGPEVLAAGAKEFLAKDGSSERLLSALRNAAGR